MVREKEKENIFEKKVAAANRSRDIKKVKKGKYDLKQGKIGLKRKIPRGELMIDFKEMGVSVEHGQ